MVYSTSRILAPPAPAGGVVAGNSIYQGEIPLTYASRLSASQESVGNALPYRSWNVPEGLNPARSFAAFVQIVKRSNSLLNDARVVGSSLALIACAYMFWRVSYSRAKSSQLVRWNSWLSDACRACDSVRNWSSKSCCWSDCFAIATDTSPRNPNSWFARLPHAMSCAVAPFVVCDGSGALAPRRDNRNTNPAPPPRIPAAINTFRLLEKKPPATGGLSYSIPIRYLSSRLARRSCSFWTASRYGTPRSIDCGVTSDRDKEGFIPGCFIGALICAATMGNASPYTTVLSGITPPNRAGRRLPQ